MGVRARVCVCVCVCVLTGGDMGPSDAKTSVEYRDKRFSYAHEKVILPVMKGIQRFDQKAFQLI